jgi:hypothetical protein
MIRHSFTFLAVGLLCVGSLRLSAQQTNDPPKVLRIFVEDVKEGKDVGHEKSESAFMEAAAKANYPANILGMTSMTGSPQAWFLEAHDTFESISKAEQTLDTSEFQTLDALDAEFRSGSHSWIAVYRPDISYHGQEMMQAMPKARVFNIIMVRLRAGHDDDFTELGKMAIDAAQKAIYDQPVAIYQVVSGLPNGTYLFFEPSASRKALDGAPARSQALMQAMGDAGSKRFLKLENDSIASSEARLFLLNPRMSYMSKDFVAADPGFWNPKPLENEKPARKAASKAKAKTAAK